VELLCYQPDLSPSQRLNLLFRPSTLEVAASQFQLEAFSSESKTSVRSDYPWSSWPDCDDKYERGRRDAGIVKDLYQGLFDADQKMAAALLEQIVEQTKRIPDTELSRLILPLLGQLLLSTDAESSAIRQFSSR
jgi:hypothetical protein